MYCKAGFHHISLKHCEHIMSLPVAPRVPERTFLLPEGYYSPEATARRREENRSRYQPRNAPGQRKPIMAAVNEAREVGDKMIF